jgi:hypothetical protein
MGSYEVYRLPAFFSNVVDLSHLLGKHDEQKGPKK